MAAIANGEAQIFDTCRVHVVIKKENGQSASPLSTFRLDDLSITCAIGDSSDKDGHSTLNNDNDVQT
jgi:hypothetical protein